MEQFHVLHHKECASVPLFGSVSMPTQHQLHTLTDLHMYSPSRPLYSHSRCDVLAAPPPVSILRGQQQTVQFQDVPEVQNMMTGVQNSPDASNHVRALQYEN